MATTGTIDDLTYSYEGNHVVKTDDAADESPNYSGAMHFYVKDHFGSNRLVVDGNGNIEEVNHYYPFGALMGDRCGVSRNKYKYIGKELDTMYGWNMQDHEARWYDIENITWSVIDAKSEIFDKSICLCRL